VFQPMDVIAVLPLDDYRLRVTFDDHTVREIDVESLLIGPLFEAVRDPEVFRQVAVVDGAITWPNGADLDTNMLYYGLPAA
jgi:hypothetical protein